MAFFIDKSHGVFLTTFPGTSCINCLQIEELGSLDWDGLARRDLCADCARHVWDRVAETTAEQKSRRRRSIFDAAPRGPLEAKMPARCGTPLAQMFIPWCEHNKPGDKLFLGVGTGTGTQEHPRVLRGATSPTSLLSPSAGTLQLPSAGPWAGPGHQAGEVPCARGVATVGDICCVNNESVYQDVPGMFLSPDMPQISETVPKKIDKTEAKQTKGSADFANCHVSLMLSLNQHWGTDISSQCLSKRMYVYVCKCKTLPSAHASHSHSCTCNGQVLPLRDCCTGLLLSFLPSGQTAVWHSHMLDGRACARVPDQHFFIELVIFYLFDIIQFYKML